MLSDECLTETSLCPTNASVPIIASGIIPVSAEDVANIPSIALSIPDFEGQFILRIFDNATESEIGCFSAIITNGNSFAQAASVGTILGIFTFVALVASFATAIYGDHIPTMRTHYAHSLSIFVVFAIYQHIFFTGALSMNWPSVLPAWWSNFAWSAGMIYSPSMQASINRIIGNDYGNTTTVGASSLGSSSDSTGGGYSISAIYKRTAHNLFARVPLYLPELRRTQDLGLSISKRDLENSSTGFDWYGPPVTPGLPLPGNFSGFAGTLIEENIPASNAFMTGFLWFLILTVIVATSVMVFKFTIEVMSHLKWIKPNRLTLFRSQWVRFTAMAVLRTTFIAFFMMVFLSLFQFVYKGPPGVVAIAVIVFVIFLVGMFGLVGYACYSRLRYGSYSILPDRLHLEHTKVLGFLPWYGLGRESQRSEKANLNRSAGSLPWWRVAYIDLDPQRVEVHQDEEYNMKFGWLSARFRRTRWWFFAFWLFYEFVRACFYGGAAGQPLTQVFGLLVVEFIAIVIVVLMKPFEGARLNVLMVYLLGFSKVATLALSAAFDPRFNLPRIITTVIGVVIIVIQGLLTIVLLVAIVVGAISSYMSLTRDREEFSPKSWAGFREKYFAHINLLATDRPAPPPPPPEEPKAPYFNVGSVRRIAKIEDEDEDHVGENVDAYGSRMSITGGTVGTVTNRASRADSMRSNMSHTNLPYGARTHRTSWSSRDFNVWYEPGTRDSGVLSRNGMHNMRSDGSLRETYGTTPVRSRAPSRGQAIPLDVMKTRANGKERERETVVDKELSQESPED